MELTVPLNDSDKNRYISDKSEKNKLTKKEHKEVDWI